MPWLVQRENGGIYAGWGKGTLTYTRERRWLNSCAYLLSVCVHVITALPSRLSLIVTSWANSASFSSRTFRAASHPASYSRKINTVGGEGGGGKPCFEGSARPDLAYIRMARVSATMSLRTCSEALNTESCTCAMRMFRSEDPVKEGRYSEREMVSHVLMKCPSTIAKDDTLCVKGPWLARREREYRNGRAVNYTLCPVSDPVRG